MGILDQAVDAVELGTSARFLFKGMLVGPSKAGKTQSALTAPGKKLLLDFDGRSETAAGWPNTKIISLVEPDPKMPAAWDKAVKLEKELWALARKNALPFDTIIEDGLSMMNHAAMYAALLLDGHRGLGGAPAQQHWLPQIKYLRDHIRSMMSLPINYVLTGHFDLEKDDSDGSIKYLPKTTKSLRTEIPNWFNEVYRCYRANEKGETTYYYQTTGTGKYDFFGSTLNHLGKFWNDPILIDFTESGPWGITRLLCSRFGEEAVTSWYGEDVLTEKGAFNAADSKRETEGSVRDSSDEKDGSQVDRKVL
jgi:hypothetical protein